MGDYMQFTYSLPAAAGKFACCLIQNLPETCRRIYQEKIKSK